MLACGAQPVGDPAQCHAIAVDARAPKFDGGIVTRLDSLPLGIVVNKHGERFYDEGEDFWPKRYAIWGQLIARQPDQIAYSIVDAKVAGTFMPSVFPPMVASSIGELARRLGLAPAVLEHTVATFNRAVQPASFNHTVLDRCRTEGLTPNKTHWARPLDAPPFWGYPLRPGITFTYLGVKVDERARVIMTNGQPAANVFAAGEIMAGNILGKGYVAGVGMTIGTVFGRIAGRRPPRMLSDDLVRHGQHVMTVCNACRYCEGYCPVFPAIEHRLTFAKGDLAYLANLCHDCGECLYACQYAPPHEFGIDVPRMMDEIRVASYEEYCWPRFLSGAFAHQRLTTMVSLAAGLIAVLLARGIPRGGLYAGDFYLVVPHDVMVTLFAAVALFVVSALVIGRARFLRAIATTVRLKPDTTYEVATHEVGTHGVATPGVATYAVAVRAFRDALTLRHLHPDGVDCTSAEETRHPWRRWFHHATFYGFALCFASTTVAAIYHVVCGWRAPYGYTSLPVVLGTLGGVGLLIGPSGLLALRRTRDPDRDAADRSALDTSFIALLFLTSLTGLLLLALREGPAMAALLIVHLAFVIALFLTLPYGKFVHGIYRTAALVKYTRERSTWTS